MAYPAYTNSFKNFFIPHPENDHKPHLLRSRMAAFALFIVAAVEIIFLCDVIYIAPRSTLLGVIEVNALVDGTNASRIADHLPALTVSPLLQAAAQAKANDMVANNYFAHTSPAGLSPWYWFQKVGYSFIYAGENLAVNFVNSEDVTSAWMNSSDHRENILNPHYTQIGMATAQGIFDGQPAVYVVELFGAPAPVMSPVKTIPKSPPTPVQPMIPRLVENETSVATSNIPLGIAIPVAAAENAPAPQSNGLQRLLANPEALANGFYYFVFAVFLIASILNFFIKIRIQHPKLILSGILVLIIAGLAIIVNQNIALLHASIL